MSNKWTGKQKHGKAPFLANNPAPGLQSAALSPIEPLWDVVEWICIVDVQPKNLHQLFDAIVSMRSKISQECFRHLAESVPRRINVQGV